MKNFFYLVVCSSFLMMIGCSHTSQKVELPSLSHRESGWYMLSGPNQDTLSRTPIVTVKDFNELLLDSDQVGTYYITGKVSRYKQQEWADKTHRSVGKYLAFVFQDSIITAPRVNARIESGMFQLSFPPGNNAKVKTLYQQIRKEKIDSIETLFQGWDKDTTFTLAQQDSIIFSLDYQEAKSWMEMSRPSSIPPKK